MALYIGRLRCGLTLKELGGYAGMNIRAVSQAAMRVEARLKREKELSTAYRKTLKISEKQGYDLLFAECGSFVIPDH